MDNSDVHSDTSMTLTAGVDGGIVGNAQGGGSYKQTNNIANIRCGNTGIIKWIEDLSDPLHDVGAFVIVGGIYFIIKHNWKWKRPKRSTNLDRRAAMPK